MNVFCSYCYDYCDTMKRCKCGRPICSVDCQKKDWKIHKHYCGKSGEFKKDWDIKMCSDEKKGFGLFALRDFDVSECIMVERPVVRVLKTNTPFVNFDHLSSSERNMFESLSSSNNDKYVDGRLLNNGFGDDTGHTNLCLAMARANHECSSNAYHLFDEANNAKVLLSLKKIAKGEEITINYCGFFMNKSERIEKLQIVYGINCDCARCNDPEEEKKIKRMYYLNEKIGQDAFRADNKQVAKDCIAMVKEMIQLFNESQYPVTDTQYASTYYDGFQVCGPHTANQAQGKKWIQLAVEHSKKAGTQFTSYKTFETYCKNPFQHQMWMVSRFK